MRPAFERLALIAACVLVVFGLEQLADRENWWHALIVGLVGVLVAGAILETVTPRDPRKPRVVVRRSDNLFESQNE